MHSPWNVPAQRVPRKIRKQVTQLARRAGKKTPPKSTFEYAHHLYDSVCEYCGTRQATTIDHIRPTCQGGANRWFNYAGACVYCNASKGGKDLLQYLLAERSA